MNNLIFYISSLILSLSSWAGPNSSEPISTINDQGDFWNNSDDEEDFYDNSISNEEISKILKNPEITRIDWSSRNINDEQAKLIARLLKTNKTLVSLSLTFNNIGNAGIEALIKETHENHTLKELLLDHNNVSDPQLIAYLVKRASLTRLDFLARK